MQFGCCIPTADYAAAEAVGFDFVEFAGVEIAAMTEASFQALCAQVRKGSVPCLALNSYCKEEPAIVGNRFSEENVRAYAQFLCSRAERLGVQMLGIGAPAARRLPPDYDPALADAQCSRYLQITAEAAKKHGIRINYESLSSAVCNYGIQLEAAVSLVRGLQMDNVSLVVDFYHRRLAGEELCNFSGFEDLIFHTHISTCGPQAKRGFPGMEELDTYRRILKALKGIGYHGTMSVEAHTADLPRDGAAALAMLRMADQA